MRHLALNLQAPLSDDVLPWLEEVALNEQGHALFTRHAGSSLPCPAIDFDEGEPGRSPATLSCLLSWHQIYVDRQSASLYCLFCQHAVLAWGACLPCP